jgi:hypothetical protein
LDFLSFESFLNRFESNLCDSCKGNFRRYPGQNQPIFRKLGGSRFGGLRGWERTIEAHSSPASLGRALQALGGL